MLGIGVGIVSLFLSGCFLLTGLPGSNYKPMRFDLEAFWPACSVSYTTFKAKAHTMIERDRLHLASMRHCLLLTCLAVALP